MKHLFSWGLVLLAACGPSEQAVEPAARPAAEAVRAESIAFQVVEEYPHDSTAFTQGLLYQDGKLYESTGLPGRSSVRVVDLESGSVEEIYALPGEYFGEGLALFDDRLYQLTWRNRLGFVYEKEGLSPVDTFTYETEGWGLTDDGTHLIMSDGTDTIYFRDPETFSVVKTISVRDAGGPVSRLNELEYVNGSIYANIWQHNRIVRIDPATGRVTGRLDLTPLVFREARADVLNGIALDPSSGRLLVTGKFWNRIYALEGTW